MAIDAVKRFGDVVRETPELKNNPALAPLRSKLLKEPQAFFKRLRDRLQADRGDDARVARPPGDGEFRPGRAHRRDRRQGGRPASLRGIAGDPGAAGAREPVGHPVPERPGQEPQQHRQPRKCDGPNSRGAGVLHERARAIRSGWQREPVGHPVPERPGHCYHNIGLHQRDNGPAGGGDGVVRAGPHDPRAAVRARTRRSSSSEANLARSHNSIGNLQIETGRPAEALASYEQARAIRSGWHARTRRSPSSRATWPAATTTSATCRVRRAGWRRRWRRTSRPARSLSGWYARTRRSPSSRRPGRDSAHHRRPAEHDGPAGGGAGVVRAGPRDPRATGTREPVGHRVPERPGREPQQHRRRAG